MNLRYSLLAFLFWLGAAWLCFPIEKGLAQASFRFNLDNSLYRIFGAAAEALGDVLFLKADSYFHGGVKEKFHEEGENLMEEGTAPQEKEETVAGDWIEKINHQVTSHAHRHLGPDSVQEMLPFFALSSSLDPHNIEALLTTAFWLDKSFLKTDEAIAVLKKGIEENPNVWELENEIAKLYLQRKKDPDSAVGHYLEAIRKSAAQKVENFKRLDMYYFLGESYFLEGKKVEALASYREALKFVDDKSPSKMQETLSEKIQALSA